MGLKIVIFGSGRGSNFQSIVDAINRNKLNAQINAVVINNPDAPMIKKAETNNLTTLVIDNTDLSQGQHEDKILQELSSYEFDLICLAGYMRILSKNFIEVVGAPIINIHPSLLPAFPGLHAQKQALNYGVKVSGCTVHRVTEEVDAGPILGQRCVPVEEDDTVDTLARRILEQEHILYPEIIQKIANGKIPI